MLISFVFISIIDDCRARCTAPLKSRLIAVEIRQARSSTSIPCRLHCFIVFILTMMNIKNGEGECGVGRGGRVEGAAYYSYNLQKSQNYLMNQNYNSLVSPKKNTAKHDFHLNTSKHPQREALFDQTPPKTQERVVRLPRDDLMKELQLFSWRAKTSLPILRVGEYALYPLLHPPAHKPLFKSDPSIVLSANKPREEPQTLEKVAAYVSSHPEVASYELKIKTEEIRCTLQDIEMLPIPQIIYLLKELLIGFEVLIDILGSFSPTQRMIILNQRHQWRVWVNEDYIISTKQTPKMPEKEFIYTIVKFVEGHAIATTQSKHLFNTLTEATYQHDCSFLKVLEKVNEFAAVNKIFHVNKVVFNSERVVSRESNKVGGHTFFHPHPEMGDSLKIIKSNLQKITTHAVLDSKTPTKPGLTQFGTNNRSTHNLISEHSLMHSPSYTNLQHNQQQCKPNNTYNFGPFSPPSLNFSQKHDPKQSQFESMCDNWEKNNLEKGAQTPLPSKYMARKHFTTGTDLSQIVYSPKAQMNQCRPNYNPHPKHQTNIKQASTIIPPIEMKKTMMTNQSPAKNRKEMKQIFHQKPIVEKPIPETHSKPASRLDEGPQKRNNKRKYSEQIVQIKSLDHLSRKEKCGHISSIYNPNEQVRSFNKIHEAVMVATPTPKTVTKQSLSPDVKGISSPNNSSSTKEIQQSGELKANYTKLKMKDLGGDKPKNNQSVINTYSIASMHDPKKEKNMAISYQFQNNDDDHSSDSERSLKRAPHKKETKWSNKISGLFSDNLSIKHLKESIRIKTKEEEHFEKEYLKDVKLDLLEKFGRKANHIVEDDDNNRLHAPYKSMQLIEQELEEGKSYLDEDMRNEDFKETRSKHLTMQVSPNFPQEEKKPSARECNSQYDDNDISSEMSSSCSNDGFNFQTEMYSINPR